MNLLLLSSQEAAPAMAAASTGFMPIGLPILIIGILVILLSFLPTIIAICRHHSQKAAIILINILLGWSIIGWIVALVWSVMQFNRYDNVYPNGIYNPNYNQNRNLNGNVSNSNNQNSTPNTTNNQQDSI